MTTPTETDLKRATEQADAHIAEVARRGEGSESSRASARRLFIAAYAQALANERARIVAKVRGYEVKLERRGLEVVEIAVNDIIGELADALESEAP